jgi:cation transport protein ChaC
MLALLCRPSSWLREPALDNPKLPIAAFQSRRVMRAWPACTGHHIPRYHGMDPDPAHVAEDLWVFAYGSLMWRPDFPFVERLEARLVGAHRALCVYSFVHRGTPERPGLVLGLDRGGTCRGIAYRVAAAARADTIAYLRAREQVTSVYRESLRPIRLRREGEPRVQALCYMVDRGHAQYAGRLSLEQQLHHVRQGHGQSGANRDYVIATVAALEQLGYRETELHLLSDRLAGTHESSTRGAAAS